MVIGANTLGSFLFQSMDPTDLSLYTYNANNVFVPVSQLVYGNTTDSATITLNLANTPGSNGSVLLSNGSTAYWSTNTAVGGASPQYPLAISNNNLVSQQVPQCGYLEWVSGTEILYTPKNGDLYKCAGQLYQIPSGGIQGGLTNVNVNGVASQNLISVGITGNGLVYYVSVDNNGVLSYWLSNTYSHMPDTTAGNIGVEVISLTGTPNTHATLVGQVWTNATPQFANTATTASWFNRVLKWIGPGNIGTYTGQATQMVAQGTGIIAVSWSDTATRSEISCQLNNAGANSASYSQFGVLYDSGSGIMDYTYAYGNPNIFPARLAGGVYLEGAHVYYIGIYGHAGGAAIGTMYNVLQYVYAFG